MTDLNWFEEKFKIFVESFGDTPAAMDDLFRLMNVIEYRMMEFASRKHQDLVRICNLEIRIIGDYIRENEK